MPVASARGALHPIRALPAHHAISLGGCIRADRGSSEHGTHSNRGSSAIRPSGPRLSELRAAERRRKLPAVCSVLGMSERPCSKAGCAEAATATLSYNYAESLAAIGPLSPAREAGGYDLCRRHADRLSVPLGWQVIRHVADA